MRSLGKRDLWRLASAWASGQRRVTGFGGIFMLRAMWGGERWFCARGIERARRTLSGEIRLADLVSTVLAPLSTAEIAV